MRLIILDSDVNYLQAIRVVVSSQRHESIEIVTASNIEEYLKISYLFSLESYLLIHEDFIHQLNNNEELVTICQENNFGILTEGISNMPLLLELCDQHHIKLHNVDDLRKQMQSCINDIYEDQIHSMGSDLDRDQIQFQESSMMKLLVMKYQPVDTLLITIKNNYLTYGQSSLISSGRSTSLISLYNPYGNLNFSSLIETTLKKFPTKFNILIIHYDPFFKSTIKTKFNLSYLFSMIKRGKSDLSLVINEIKISLNSQIDMITGPGNMLDIDCLSDHEQEIYFQNLKNLSNYDFIIFNLNGIHVTNHIHTLLKSSRDCILCHNEEDVQLSVQRQTSVTWTMMLDNLAIALSEVMMNHGK